MTTTPVRRGRRETRREDIDGQPDRGDRHRVRGPHDRSVLRPPGPQRHLRRHRRGQGRAAPRGRSRSTSPVSKSWCGRACRAGRLTFTDRPHRAPSPAPPSSTCACRRRRVQDGSADLSYLEAAARQIGPAPPGRDHGGQQVHGAGGLGPASSSRSSVAATSSVVSNPEFLREGSAVHDFLHPDRVVIGSDDQGAAIRMASLYLGLPAPLMVTDPASAETIKYASNAFLAMKLSFVNAVANLCEVGGRRRERRGAGHGLRQAHRHEFLRPGPGWGGSCFPKDTRALRFMAAEAGLRLRPPRRPARHQRRAVRPRRRQGGRTWPAADVAGREGRGVGPHLQGQHRRPAGLAGDRGRSGAWSTPGARSPPTTPRSSDALPELPEVIVVDDAVRRVPGRRRPRACSPSGTSSSGSTSTRSAEPMAPRASSTPATCSTAAACCVADSRTTASAAEVSGGTDRRHRGSGLPRLAHLRRPARPRRRGRRDRQPRHRQHLANIEHLFGRERLPASCATT